MLGMSKTTFYFQSNTTTAVISYIDTTDTSFKLTDFCDLQR